MKIKYIALIASMLFFSASGCRKNPNRNPYLQDVSFDISINLDLPQYASLQYPGSSLYIAQGGIKGIFVFNTGDAYNAFEASDPNHYPNDCSLMQLDGTSVLCPCENNRYSLTDGHLMSGEGNYGLKPYHVSLNGNMLHIYN